MAIMTSSSFAKLLWPGVNAIWGKEYTEYPQEWTKLGFEQLKSTRAYEEDVGLSSYGLFQKKAEGATISYDSERQGFTTRYTHGVFALGFIITREMFEDDQYDQVGSQKAKGLAFSMRQTKEILAHNVFNNAYSASYTGGDGVSLVSNAHPNVAGGTWSNRPATFCDLSEAALEDASIQIAGYTNDRGLRIAVRPQKLVIPYQLAFEAQRILKTDGRVGTDLNDINALKQMGLIPEVVTSHYLTDTNGWFLVTDVNDGLKYFERRADEFAQADNDFETENAKFKASFRCSWGWTDPRAVYGNSGS
jgi:hypothetical protein